MAIMEGPLSKWTNVVRGWQFRWFVLDENSGLLSYYTSKEKMMRGARRGCVRLKSAVIGIDDEDDSTFTITVDQKTFHFQARNAEEKERWIEALEITILRHSNTNRRMNYSAPNVVDFDKKLSETDAYLQILLDQVKALEVKIEECDDEGSKAKYDSIKGSAEAMIESIKQGIVLLQITKHVMLENYRSSQKANQERKLQNTVHTPLANGPAFESEESYLNGDLDTSGEGSPSQTKSISKSTESIKDSKAEIEEMRDQNLATSTSLPNLTNTVSPPTESITPTVSPIVREAPSNESQTNLLPSGANSDSASVPEMSYSSSEDEDFFDAEDAGECKTKKPNYDEEQPANPPQVIAVEDDYFDELYDDNSEDKLESLDEHGSIITHLLSQVRIGMDLTKIVLPTFILERRSLLEMYADFLAHPDLFSGIADQTTPRDRMVQCVRWYMSAFHAGRKSQVAKKPYNPIIGETFQCYYQLPDETPTGETVEDGPVPWAGKNNVSFISEQVSHHPPISAFYAENYDKRISLDGYIWTKSKFLGLSIGVHMIGQAVISVIDYDEEYIVTFPNGYGRSILTVPWIELGGKIQLTCAKTGYYANIEFHTKPFYGGKKDRVTADIFAPNEKKPFCSIQGEWNGAMWAKYTSGMNESFVDTKKMPIIKKIVKPIDTMDEYESRRLWRDVTLNLKAKDVEKATEHKRFLEQRQRDEAKERKEKGETWQTKKFHENGEHWGYIEPLVKRLGKQTPT